MAAKRQTEQKGMEQQRKQQRNDESPALAAGKPKRRQTDDGGIGERRGVLGVKRLSRAGCGCGIQAQTASGAWMAWRRQGHLTAGSKIDSARGAGQVLSCQIDCRMPAAGDELTYMGQLCGQNPACCNETLVLRSVCNPGRLFQESSSGSDFGVIT
ncbi:MAG: hypothetical protein JNN31_09110 [Dechloromonas sp.]|nr:hypothetical protein [Dechloromonas sp.]